MNRKHIMYLQIAQVIARQSYCEKQKNGAVLEKQNNIIAMGYNGTPAGFSNSCELNGVTRPEVLHAESNAIAKCARSTQSAEGAVLYCTTAPCIECAKVIIQCGISEVYFIDYYRLPEGLTLLARAGIKTEQITV